MGILKVRKKAIVGGFIYDCSNVISDLTVSVYATIRIWLNGATLPCLGHRERINPTSALKIQSGG